MTEAYPLHWPDGWPRTVPAKRLWSLPGGRTGSPGWNRVTDRLFNELRLLGARSPVLSTNQPLRRDGMPYAATRIIHDPAAAVYFELNGRQMVMAQDRYEDLADNIRSLSLAIEGLRQMQRHGGAHMMERAFSGFEALPAPGQAASAVWWRVLGVSENATKNEIITAFREKAKTAHPDAGGSHAAMAELNNARAEGLKAVR